MEEGVGLDLGLWVVLGGDLWVVVWLVGIYLFTLGEGLVINFYWDVQSKPRANYCQNQGVG